MTDQIFSYFDNAVAAGGTTYPRLEPGTFNRQILERYRYTDLWNMKYRKWDSINRGYVHYGGGGGVERRERRDGSTVKKFQLKPLSTQPWLNESAEVS
jgi:hypothetical protein